MIVCLPAQLCAAGGTAQSANVPPVPPLSAPRAMLGWMANAAHWGHQCWAQFFRLKLLTGPYVAAVQVSAGEKPLSTQKFHKHCSSAKDSTRGARCIYHLHVFIVLEGI